MYELFKKYEVLNKYLGAILTFAVVESLSHVCDPMDGRPLGSSVHVFSQARILEGVALSFSRGSSQPKNRIESTSLALQADSFHCATRVVHIEIYCCSSVAKSCPTLCDPVDCSPWGSSVHGISLTRILEWVAVFFSRGSSWLRKIQEFNLYFLLGRHILEHWAPSKAHLNKNSCDLEIHLLI